MATATSNAGLGRKNAFDAVAASQNDSALVAAVAGKRIRVHSVVINHGDTTPSAVTFESATAAIYPPLKAAANGVLVLPDNQGGWFQTLAGEALNVDTGAGSTTSIAVAYSLVT